MWQKGAQEEKRYMSFVILYFYRSCDLN